MIYSMTAFARLADQGDWGMATWELRTVNYRYFDCVLKLPDILRHLETNVRTHLQQQLHRGRVECILKFQPGENSGLSLMLNTGLVKKLADAIAEVKNYVPSVATIDPIRILSWPQVLQITEEDNEGAQKVVWQLFEKAVAELIATREREGALLMELTKNKLQEVMAIVSRVKGKIPQVLTNQRAKIMLCLGEIKTGLDQGRLEQEMVYLAQKIDIVEELERLEIHGKEVGRALLAGGNVGKRLDFLMQELNREANTLAAKSIDADITQAAIELKVMIEQMREQVQNMV